MIPIYNNFEIAIKHVIDEFRSSGSPVTSLNWQSMERNQDMYEAQRVSFSCNMPDDLDILRAHIKPNLPWADDHFWKERVGGEPLNPGSEYKNWPYYKYNPSNDKFRTDEKFSHTYMERIWPKHAGEYLGSNGNYGLRYRYGDLADLLKLLQKDPHTRQAFLPIWFPEDTGAVSNQRVPCTLGYLFTRRNKTFNITYYIRSCDFLRHFRDDVYMAVLLALWVLDRLKSLSDPKDWPSVQPGIFTMHIESLHVFLPEYKLLRYD